MSDNQNGPSHAALVLFQRLQQATTKEERTRLTRALALQFVADHDETDSSATDDYHIYFEEFAKAKLAYEQAILRVGRLASECINQYLATENTTIEEATQVQAGKSLN